MEAVSLLKFKPGKKGYISKCLSPNEKDVYRTLEMGLYEGAKFRVVRSLKFGKGMELALNNSRLVIGYELASQFLAVGNFP